MRLRGERRCPGCQRWVEIIKVAKQFPLQPLACRSPPGLEFSRPYSLKMNFSWGVRAGQ